MGAETFDGCMCWIGVSRLSLNPSATSHARRNVETTPAPNPQGLWLALGWLADALQPHHATNNSQSPSIIYSCLLYSSSQMQMMMKRNLMPFLLLSGGGRYGIRGAYTEPKSKDFFDLLLYQFSEWWFKVWLR
jgi:hypothetical protein